MIKSISDFELAQCITTDGCIAVYRARFLATNDPCIIKIPAYDTTPEPATSFLKHEYALCSARKADNILKLNRLVKINNSCLLECEDLDILPFGFSEQSSSTSPGSFFAAALEITQQIATLHKDGLIHGNLTPYSIMKRISTGDYFLTGFYISSTTLQNNKTSSQHLHYPPGIRYIAPEQTGNIDLSTDERSDLYSLGCIFYEMLTGEPPFTDVNTSSLLYSHVARDPIPVHEKNTQSPRFLSDIIGKLLEKNPADRYQSAHGVFADLQECQLHFRNGGGKEKSFTLGLRDRRTRLIQPNNLYGRTAEQKLLNDKLLDARKNSASALFISGAPGVGKTALLNRFVQSLDYSRYLVARGTCEESMSTAPFHGLKTALGDLIRTIISQGNEEIALWRDTLRKALPFHRDLVTDFIPELQMILGTSSQKSEPSADLIQGTQFKTVFTQLLRSFLSEDRVFVLVIDDLQWADSALSTLLGPAFFDIPSSKFVFIGAGRIPFSDDNRIFSGFKSSGATCSELELDVLSSDDSQLLIADALGDKNADFDELTKLLYSKTNGNPLFLNAFLEMLIERKLLRHYTSDTDAASSPRWEWESEKIAQLNYSENVIDIIIGKIEELPKETIDLLTIASFIGMRFLPEIVGSFNGTSFASTCSRLESAIDAGIIQRTANNDSLTNEWYFCHERIREALIGRLSEEERTSLHLITGRKLLELQKQGKSDVSVSDIVRHFNICPTISYASPEIHEIIRLNKQAGYQARNAYAYDIALRHFITALDLLTISNDTTSFNLKFELELALAECNYLLSHFDEAEKRLLHVRTWNLDPSQKAALDWVLISTYDHQQKIDAAMDVAFNRLKAMGISIPRKPSPVALVSGLLKSAFAIRGLKVTDKDISSSFPEDLHASFKLLTRLWVHAFSLQKQGVVVAIATHLILCMKQYGVCGLSSVALCFWGILVGMITRNPKSGLKYGNRAMEIANRFDDSFSRGITNFLYGSFFAHLEGHLNNAVQILADGQRFSYEAGDVVTSSNCTEGLLLYRALSGKNLSALQLQAQDSTRFNQLIGVPEDGLTIPRFIYSWTTALNSDLQTAPSENLSHANDFPPMTRGIMLLFHLFSAVILGENKSALRYVRALKRNPILDPTSYFFYFYTALHALATSRLLNDSSSFMKRRVLAKNRNILKKGVTLSSVNILPLYHLVNAEFQRHDRKNWDAMISYQKAIDIARDQEFPHFAGLASEYYADFLKVSQYSESRRQLKNALTWYYDWGCSAKVTRLQDTAPDFPFTPRKQESASGFAEIDIHALLKSLESISNELLLNRLLEKLIRIVMENVGAQRGVLILEQNNTFIVRVEGNLPTSGNGIEAQAINAPSDQYSLPHGIISYVTKSREPVRLEWASQRGRFVHEPYIRNNEIKSVLCVPLINNECIRGIIYLENNTMEAAFPPSRLLLLRLLGSQAIISIDNALFHDIEIKHLQSKVNPHFIFNALSSIAELCHVDADTAEDAIIKLSTLYRYILTSEMHQVTLEDELEIVRKYLSIEKLRFEDRLAYSIRTIGDISQVRMPCMLIQPLVENSIKHGISPRHEGGTISILAAAEKGRCTVTVEDNGAGVSTNTSGTGYGLESIRKRLALQYQDKAAFEINDAGGFKVTFSFPFEQADCTTEINGIDADAIVDSEVLASS